MATPAEKRRAIFSVAVTASRLSLERASTAVTEQKMRESMLENSRPGEVTIVLGYKSNCFLEIAREIGGAEKSRGSVRERSGEVSRESSRAK